MGRSVAMCLYIYRLNFVPGESCRMSPKYLWMLPTLWLDKSLRDSHISFVTFFYVLLCIVFENHWCGNPWRGIKYRYAHYYVLGLRSVYERTLVPRLLKPVYNSFRYTSNHVKFRAEAPMYIISFTMHVFKVTAALLLLSCSSLSTTEQYTDDTERALLANSVHSAAV